MKKSSPSSSLQNLCLQMESHQKETAWGLLDFLPGWPDTACLETELDLLSNLFSVQVSLYQTKADFRWNEHRKWQQN